MLRATYGLLRDSGRVLLEIAPEGLDVDEIGDAIARHPGVTEVHDLHVWGIGSGFPWLSAHVLVRPSDDCHTIRRQLERSLDQHFGIEHTALQVDHAATRTLSRSKARATQRHPEPERRQALRRTHELESAARDEGHHALRLTRPLAGLTPLRHSDGDAALDASPIYPLPVRSPATSHIPPEDTIGVSPIHATAAALIAGRPDLPPPQRLHQTSGTIQIVQVRTEPADNEGDQR